jgi:hypothetical protein
VKRGAPHRWFARYTPICQIPTWKYDQRVKSVVRTSLALLISAALSHAETVTGVVYAKEAGNGAHPSGSINLAVGRTIRPMIWTPFLEDRRSPGCEDIGAIWTVETDGDPSLPDIEQVTCKGVDKDAHDAWLLVSGRSSEFPCYIANSLGSLPLFTRVSEA